MIALRVGSRKWEFPLVGVAVVGLGGCLVAEALPTWLHRAMPLLMACALARGGRLRLANGQNSVRAASSAAGQDRRRICSKSCAFGAAVSGVTWAPWVLQGLRRYRLGLRSAIGTRHLLCAEALPIGRHADVLGLAGSMYSRATVS